MSKEQTYCKTLTEVANILQIPYTALYKHRHRPEFTKSQRGYNVKKITQYLDEQEAIKEEEERTQNLLGAEEELLEKQVKLEHARLKCRLLELQILTKEGNLIDVNTVLETRTKEITRLRRSLTDMVKHLPKELIEQDEATIRSKISDAVNGILADLSEFITDDWTETENEEELEEL
jgi:hypothetical protein